MLNNATSTLPVVLRSHRDGVDHLGRGVEHALPDARQVPQVEDVVELGGRGQHLGLGGLPEATRQGDQAGHGLAHLLAEAPPRAVVAGADHPWRGRWEEVGGGGGGGGIRMRMGQGSAVSEFRCSEGTLSM